MIDCFDQEEEIRLPALVEQFVLFFTPLAGTVWLYDKCPFCKVNVHYKDCVCPSCEDKIYLDSIPMKGFF